MIKAFKAGYIGSVYTIWFIYGYFKKGFELEVELKHLLSKNNIEYAYEVLKNERKNYIESI